MQNAVWTNSRNPRTVNASAFQGRYRSRRASLKVRTLDAITFIIPALFWFNFSFVGQLVGGEVIVLILIIPFVITSWKNRIWRGYNKPLLILMGTWLLSQIVSDFYNHSRFDSAARGESLIAFFAINFIVLTVLIYGNERRIIYFALGSVIGKAFGTYLWGFSNADWKFDYSSFVVPAGFLLACYIDSKGRYWAGQIIALALSAISVSQAARSMALITLIAGALAIPLLRQQTIPPSRFRRPTPNLAITASPRFNPKLFVVLVSVLIAGFGLSKAYSYFASTGALGDEAQQKYEMQSRGKLGLLVGGRPETMISWRAVMDAPLLGHGSWAEDPKYGEMLTDLEQESGYVEESGNDKIESYLIPTHSHLMSAWVYAGIFGAAFWFYVFYLVLKTISWLVTHRPPLMSYYSYLMALSLWDILFSPFGMTRRLEVSFVLVVMCTLLESTERKALDPLRNLKGTFGPRIIQSPARAYRPADRRPITSTFNPFRKQ